MQNKIQLLLYFVASSALSSRILCYLLDKADNAIKYNELFCVPGRDRSYCIFIMIILCVTKLYGLYLKSLLSCFNGFVRIPIYFVFSLSFLN